MNRLLQKLAQSLRHWGIIPLRTSHPAMRYMDHQPNSLFAAIVLQIFPHLHGLRFIQIGSNDGQRCDPIQSFIDRHAWEGLMFEPLKVNFAELQRFRGNTPRIRLYNAAVDLLAGKQTLYNLDPAAAENLPEWTRGLGSFSRERLEEAVRELRLPDSAIIAEEVTTFSWDQVWQEFGSHRCDLLLLDTEGYDLTLLRASRFAEHRPRVIHFEHACVTAEDRLQFYGELLVHGYEFATEGTDTTAWLKK